MLLLLKLRMFMSAFAISTHLVFWFTCHICKANAVVLADRGLQNRQFELLAGHGSETRQKTRRHPHTIQTSIMHHASTSDETVES
jgi:hypothetical protein